MAADFQQVNDQEESTSVPDHSISPLHGKCQAHRQGGREALAKLAAWNSSKDMCQKGVLTSDDLDRILPYLSLAELADLHSQVLHYVEERLDATVANLGAADLLREEEG
mmetsp:Transcript_19876/g.34928  ORF Transcript_19876/g.34928 Transcript_19876/m.34928 type:complete len:109 (+) Transcript_19876:408-734(+)